MVPTRADVRARYLGLLDDDAGKVYTETVFAPAFAEAYDALFTAFLQGQVPRIRNIIVKTVPPLTTSLTPADAGITDFGDYIALRERRTGSADPFRQLSSVETLMQRTMADRLIEFNWRWDTFYFVGATTSIDLEITYESSGTAPTDPGTSIGVDSSLTFLSNYAVGVSGQRKGNDEMAQRCWNLAVGPKYNDGIMGGELFRLVQARVRSEQKTPVAPRPFTTQRRFMPRMAPFVSAGGSSGGSSVAPVQFSTAAGTITPAPDGLNPVFFLAYPVTSVAVIRNGETMTPLVDYTAGFNVVTFQAGQIPAVGDNLLVLAWL